MATKTKRTKLGNYITKTQNNYDIRLKITTKKSPEGKVQTGTHEFVVCRGKNKIVGGFKTKEEAIDAAVKL